MDGNATPAIPVISYTYQRTAADYSTWDDAGCWLLGYPFVPIEAGLSGTDVHRVLDLGCGSGTIARWLAANYHTEIVGVDTSAPMLALAAENHDHPGIEYHLSVDDRLTFLPSGSIDAAVSCFVFNCVPERERMRRIFTEVHRVLRPGGRFTVLSPHDGQAGVRFDSFRRGDPDASYRSGDTIPIDVQRRDGSWLRITNIFWEAATFHELFREAGFSTSWQREPVLEDAVRVADPELLDARAWETERTRPPFLLVTGQVPA